MNTKNLNWHNVRMTVLGVIAFIIGSVQLLHAQENIIPTMLMMKLDALLPFLILLEHQLAGDAAIIK